MSAPTRAVRWGLVLALAISLEARPQAIDPGAEASVYRLDLELGAEYSDNPGRFDPSGPDDTVIVPRLVLDLARSGRRWQARAEGFLEYRESIENQVDDQFRGNLAAVIDWFIVPDSLTWTLQDVASVESVNLFAVDAPDNLQQTNVLITGPAWRIRPGAAWEALVDARFIHSQAERIDAFNSDRLSASGRLLRRLTATRSASLGAEFTDVSYRDSPADRNDYERIDAFARWRSMQARTSLDLAAGYTWIEPDFLPSISAPLVRITLGWNIHERDQLGLSARHELSDSVRQLTTAIDALDLPAAATVRLPVGAEIYTLDEVELRWTRGGARGELSLVPFWRDYEFETIDELDYRELGAQLNGLWRLSTSLNLVGSLATERRRFDIDQRRDTDYHAALFVSRNFTPRWSARIGAIRHQRNSSAPGEDSRENIVAVYVTLHAGR